MYPEDDYYENNPNDVVEDFWIVKIKKIIDDGNFDAFYLACGENKVYAPWLENETTQKFSVNVIIHHGPLLTKQKKIAVTHMKKIEAALKFEKQVNSITGYTPENS